MTAWKPEYVIAAIAVAGGALTASISALSAHWTAESARQTVAMQMSVSILSADPGKSDVSPARQWAVRVLEKNSGERFTDQERDELLHHPLKCGTGTLDFSDPCNSALIGAL